MKSENKTSRQQPVNKKKIGHDTAVHPAGHDGKEIHSDVLGSYTGITEEGERPIQDADDL